MKGAGCSPPSAFSFPGDPRHPPPICFIEIIPCVLFVPLGEEEEEEKGQAARGDQR